MGYDLGDDYDKMELPAAGVAYNCEHKELTARLICGSFGCKGLIFGVP
jgi:hypothetical protein